MCPGQGPSSGWCSNCLGVWKPLVWEALNSSDNHDEEHDNGRAARDDDGHADDNVDDGDDHDYDIDDDGDADGGDGSDDDDDDDVDDDDDDDDDGIIVWAAGHMGNCSLQKNYSNDVRLRKRFAQEIPTRESHKGFAQRNRSLRIVLALLFCAGE